jgi:hypothetical protein
MACGTSIRFLAQLESRRAWSGVRTAKRTGTYRRLAEDRPSMTALEAIPNGINWHPWMDIPFT